MSAHADVTVYITGATAYRGPAISAFKSFLDGGYVAIYGAKTGVTSESNAANVAFRGTSVANPGLGVVTIKAAWGGSVGGVKLIQSTTTFNIDSQPGVLGWIPDTALPAGNGVAGSPVIFAGTEDSTNFTILAADSSGAKSFERGAGAAKPVAAFSDAFQASALGGAAGDAVGLGTDTATGKIGVIPFDFVVCNGVTPGSVTKYVTPTFSSGSNQITYASKAGDLTTGNIGRVIAGAGIPIGTTITADSGTVLTISANTTAANTATLTSISSADTAVAPISNITANQANQLAQGGGKLSLFTGNASDAGVGVYLYGRNADSGTRISFLGESGRGITARPSFHLQPTFTPAGPGSGKGGAPGNLVTGLKKWPTESVLSVVYTSGQSGYTGGGDLAGALSSPGSTSATMDAATLSGFNPGWMIGYLGRNDARDACARTFGQNTAKRLTFNGQQDWNGTSFNVDGTPVSGYNDTAVREGNYQAWEFEHFFKKATIPDGGATDTVLDAIAANILAQSAPGGTISLSTMHATRSVEGGPISY
ncbi:MAG: hypothetical protein ABIT76_06605 [Chthoniobacterales bacterium]